MIVVSNATPIITLSAIGRIDLMETFFDRVYLPQAVYDEIKAKKAYGFREVDESFFVVKSINDIFAQNILLNDLDIGEAQTIVLAKEMKADIVLIDESIGYNIARSQQLNVSRTLSLLITAKEKRIVTNIKPLLDDMIAKGRWISRRVYADILKICNEEQ